MIKCLLGLPALFLSTGLLAQPKAAPSRWSIALTAGPAIPVGAFAGIHNSWADNPTVATGGSMEISGAYHIWRCFSAAAAINGHFNNGNGIPDGLVQVYSYGNGAVPSPGIFGNDWQMARFLAGGLFTIPLSKQTGTVFLLRALAGIQKTRTPDFASPDPSAVPPYTNMLYFPGQNLSSTFAYQLDAGVQWRLHGNWALLANAGYDGARPSLKPNWTVYPPAELIPGPNIIGYIQPGPLNQKVSLPTGTIFLRAGVAYRW